MSGATPKLTALACLAGACALLLLVYCTAPAVRPPPPDATPVVVVATLESAPTLATLLAGPPTTRTPTPLPTGVPSPTVAVHRG